MQLDRSSPPPVIILQAIPKFVSDGNMELYFIDRESHNVVERKIIEIDSCYKQRDNPILLLGSHDGFLLFTNCRWPMFMQGRSVLYAWNPVTNQKSVFRSPSSRLHVCGIYFCSIKKEYILLYFSKNRAPFEFKMYNIGTKTWENVGKFSYPPSCERPPVIINKTLFWMIDQESFHIATGDFSPDSHYIVSFEFETKKFGIIGRDGLSDMSLPDRFHSYVHLFELEEELYICDFSKWIKLELSVLDQGSKCWVKKHIVIVPIRDNFFLERRHYGSFGRWVNTFTMEVFPYKKGELLVRADERLLIYNLHSNTCRLVESKELKDSNFQTVVHIDSLVSL